MGAGLYGYLNMNPHFAEVIQPSYLNDSSNCPLPKPHHHKHTLLHQQLLFSPELGRASHLASSWTDSELVSPEEHASGDAYVPAVSNDSTNTAPPAEESVRAGWGARLRQSKRPFRLDVFLSKAWIWILAVAAGSVGVGLALLALLNFNAPSVIMGVIALQVATPAAAAGVALYKGYQPAAVSLLLLSGMTMLLYVLWKQQIALVSRLLSVASSALMANPGIILLALGIQALIAQVAVPLVLAVAATLTNGQVVTNPDRDMALPDACVDEGGAEVQCCVWQWWYLFPAGEPASISAPVRSATHDRTLLPSNRQAGATPRVLLALRHALGPSLGSLCLSSALLALVSLLRQVTGRRARSPFPPCKRPVRLYDDACEGKGIEGETPFLKRSVRLYDACEGEGTEAGQKAVEKVREESATSMVAQLLGSLLGFLFRWLPPLILQTTSLLLALLWGAGAYGLSHSQWVDDKQGESSARVLGVIAFLAAWVVLAYLTSILISVVEVLFVLYGRDIDEGVCRLPEVHAVYAVLPSQGKAVVHPDNTISYGSQRNSGAV
ncbi:MAG: hypothetical protein WDW38_010912 [Sanguina aurantia]